MKKAIAALLLVVTLGCKTTSSTSDSMRSWIGHTETELVQSWGAPQRVYKLQDGSKILTYTYHRNGNESEGTAYKDAYGVVHYSNPEKDGYDATREFTINSQGVVTNWRWHGQ